MHASVIQSLVLRLCQSLMQLKLLEEVQEFCVLSLDFSFRREIHVEGTLVIASMNNIESGLGRRWLSSVLNMWLLITLGYKLSRSCLP